jgi:hypothetical protein
MNARADVAALARAFRGLLPSEARIAELSIPECLAAMRDLGLGLGSLKRHGVEPLEAIPELEAPLSVLGVRTDMVPRDTVYHYGPWNPPGRRQRMYLGSPQEDALIRSVRLAIPEVEAAIRLLTSLLAIPPEDPLFAATLRQAAARLEAMVCAIDLVRSDVTADYFARVIRPYFEPVSVAGVSYFGPAAAHLPLCLVDTLLWGADHAHAAHRSFQDESVTYSPACWRQLFERVRGQQSITTRVVEALASTRQEPTAAVGESVAALCSLYRVLITFRGRHVVLARAAYRAERRLYARGSGGGTVQLLEEILRLTRDYACAVRPGAAAVSDAPHCSPGGSVQP